MGPGGVFPAEMPEHDWFLTDPLDEDTAERLLAGALQLDKSGIFSLVLEGIPSEVARRVTESVSVPTIGIGAGPHCDGQVLVINDMLGIGGGRYPKFVKTYANLREEITRAVRTFASEVEAGTFPDEEHSYK
jgi:3-methyl-2-oxobutanoate hydroxymethyltransferase